VFLVGFVCYDLRAFVLRGLGVLVGFVIFEVLFWCIVYFVVFVCNRLAVRVCGFCGFLGFVVFGVFGFMRFGFCCFRWFWVCGDLRF